MSFFSVSCLDASCLDVSCLVVSCLDVSCLDVSCLVVSCLDVSCLDVSCLDVSCLVASCLDVSCLDVQIEGRGMIQVRISSLFMITFLPHQKAVHSKTYETNIDKIYLRLEYKPHGFSKEIGDYS